MIKSKNKGITLIALVITIIVLLIIAGITITGSITGVDEANTNKLLTELDMVQHAVLERYTKYSLTKDEDLLVGTQTSSLPSIGDNNWQIQSPSKPYEYYYTLVPEDLNMLGITNTEDTYIVNYSTGEVYNNTTKTTVSGDILYKSATTNVD